MIEGKLTEGSQDPRRIQVLLREAENRTHVSLQDETGVSWVGFTIRCLMENGTHMRLQDKTGVCWVGFTTRCLMEMDRTLSEKYKICCLKGEVARLRGPIPSGDSGS